MKSMEKYEIRKICMHDIYKQNMQQSALPTLLMNASIPCVYHVILVVRPGRRADIAQRRLQFILFSTSGKHQRR